MGKRKKQKSGNELTAKLAIITALLALLSQVVNLLQQVVNWVTGK